jgi:urea transporter
MGPPTLSRAIELDAANTAVRGEDLFRIVIVSISQVFLINNITTGIFFLLGLTVNSRPAAVFALVGSALATTVALLFGAAAQTISGGLYGFSAVLTAIAVGCVFYSPTFRSTLYTLVAVVFTVFVQAAINVLLTPVGIPTLTAPFVFATWLFLLPKEKFRPLHDERLLEGIFTKN